MTSLYRTLSRVSVRPPLRVISVRTTYSNPNKPNSKQEVKKAVDAAESGKATQDVNKQRAVGGESLARETSSEETKGSTKNQKSDPINTADAGPDVLRQASKKNGKKSA